VAGEGDVLSLSFRRGARGIFVITPRASMATPSCGKGDGGGRGGAWWRLYIGTAAAAALTHCVISD